MAKKEKVPKAVDTNKSSKSVEIEDLASVLQASLNADFKGLNYKVASIFGQDDDIATDVKDWISTGSTLLDLAVSNRPNCGVPCGKILEFSGLEGSGKTLLAAHICAETQKRGGFAVYIDTESALSSEFIEAIGVDKKKLLYMQLETIEDCLDAVEKSIIKFRETNKKTFLTIVVDSVMGASTKAEMDANFDKDGYATQKAIVMGKGLRKITNLIARENVLVVFTNQLRVNMNAMFGEKYSTSAGKALPFHASVRLRITSVGKLKAKVHGVDQIIGVKTLVKVIKNRVGPPHKAVEFDIYFDRGIDDTGSMLELLKTYKILTKVGSKYVYANPETGEEIYEFKESDYEDLKKSKPEIHDTLYRELCDLFIMKYKSSELSKDDIETDVSEDQ